MLFITFFLSQIRDQMSVDGVKPFDEWIPTADLPSEAQPCSTGQIRSGSSSSLLAE